MIETARLRLRAWRDADKPAFEAIINTPAMMAHFDGVKPPTEIDALIDRQMAAQASDGFSMWAVELLEPWPAGAVRSTAEGRLEGGASTSSRTASRNMLAGICGLRRSDVYAGTPVAGMLEIGWRIAEPLWGRGVAREAAAAALGWGWANTADPLIGAWTSPRNERSWGLMRRLGMVRRPELDFHHPRYAADDPIGEEIVYTIARPA